MRETHIRSAAIGAIGASEAMRSTIFCTPILHSPRSPLARLLSLRWVEPLRLRIFAAAVSCARHTAAAVMPRRCAGGGAGQDAVEDAGHGSGTWIQGGRGDARTEMQKSV